MAAIYGFEEKRDFRAHLRKATDDFAYDGFDDAVRRARQRRQFNSQSAVDARSGMDTASFSFSPLGAGILARNSLASSPEFSSGGSHMPVVRQYQKAPTSSSLRNLVRGGALNPAQVSALYKQRLGGLERQREAREAAGIDDNTDTAAKPIPMEGEEYTQGLAAATGPTPFDRSSVNTVNKQLSRLATSGTGLTPEEKANALNALMDAAFHKGALALATQGELANWIQKVNSSAELARGEDVDISAFVSTAEVMQRFAGHGFDDKRQILLHTVTGKLSQTPPTTPDGAARTVKATATAVATQPDDASTIGPSASQRRGSDASGLSDAPTLSTMYDASRRGSTATGLSDASYTEERNPEGLPFRADRPAANAAPSSEIPGMRQPISGPGVASQTDAPTGPTMNEFQQDLSEILQTTQRVLTQGELSEADIRDITAFENAVRTAALEVVSTDGLDAVAHRLTSMPGYAALNRAIDRMIAARRNNSSASEASAAGDAIEMFGMLDQLIEEAKDFKRTAASSDRERTVMDEFISLLTRGRQSVRTNQDFERLSDEIRESAAMRMLIDRGPPRREAPRPPSSSPTQSDQSPYSLQTPSTGLSDISSNSSHNVDSNQKKNTPSVARQLDLGTSSSSASKSARSFLDRVRGVFPFSRSSSPKRMPESTTPRDESREEAYARATSGTITRRRLETPSTMSSLEDSRAYESAMSSGTKRRNESQAAPPPSAAKQPRSTAKPPSATKPSAASSEVTPSKSALRKEIADLKNTPAVRKWWKDNYPNINAGTIPRALNSVDMAKAWVKTQLGLKEEEHPDDSIYDV